MGKCHSKREKQSLYVRDKEGNVLTDSHKAQQRRQRERGGREGGRTREIYNTNIIGRPEMHKRSH